MISIKDKSVLYNIMRVPYDETLIGVIMWLDGQFPDRIIITSGYRPGSGVHGTTPCRAVDIRSWIFKDPELRANYINHAWEYDYERPNKLVCLYHESKPGADDWHFHIQVHKNTRLRI